MKSILPLILLAQLCTAAPFVIDDVAMEHSFQVGLGSLKENEKHRSGEHFGKILKDAPKTCGAPPKVTSAPEDAAASVYMIGAVYNCGKCDEWHTAGVATAWCLSADGLMVTNHHLFAKAKGEIMGVCDREGKAYAITEIVASDPVEDVVIFRVDGKGLIPLPLGEPAEIGSRVHVIGHPNKDFYVHTFGDVSRYTVSARGNEKNTRMVISAEYAKGSSGGPVLNSDKQIVGMVSSTQPIYYSTSKDGKATGPLQMTIRNCVPVSSILKMFKAKDEAPKGE